MEHSKAREVDLTKVHIPEVVRTARLVLRMPSLDDAMQLAHARSESFHELHPWFYQTMGRRQQEADPNWQIPILRKQIEAWSQKERFAYFVWLSDELIGSVELVPIWRRGQFRLAYWIRSSRARLGYGTEAVSGMIRFAFEAMDARLVTTGHAEGNAASARLARTLGFELISRQPLACEMPDRSLVSGIGYAIQDTAVLPTMNVKWD